MRQPFKLSATLLPSILLVVAVLVCVSMWRLPVGATADLLGPKVYPGALAVLLAVFSGLLLAGVGTSHGEDRAITLPGMVRRFIPLVLFSAVYVAALPYLGFLIATAALLMACFTLLGERRLWMSLLVAIGCTLATYLLFATFLGIQLPAFPG